MSSRISLIHESLVFCLFVFHRLHTFRRLFFFYLFWRKFLFFVFSVLSVYLFIICRHHYHHHYHHHHYHRHYRYHLRLQIMIASVCLFFSSFAKVISKIFLILYHSKMFPRIPSILSYLPFRVSSYFLSFFLSFSIRVAQVNQRLFLYFPFCSFFIT